ncbi:MAG: hypothetical protein K0R90_518 [Oscillospiraceae bacterium]|jgi:hypothetical protein|nr:hypothetical protein [Oscillospiraceae bacterium]
MKKNVCLLITALLAATLSGCGTTGSTSGSSSIISSSSVAIVSSNLSASSLDAQSISSETSSGQTKTSNASSAQGISKQEALVLVEDQIDKAQYQIKLANENKIIENESYYLFSVSNSKGVMDPQVAVRKVHPEVICYYKDGHITQFKDSPFFTDWNGNFERTLDTDTATLKINVTDNQDFEFTIKAQKGKNSASLAGTAQITGFQAIYSDDKGHKLNFTMKNNAIAVVDEGKNKYASGTIDFDGVYTKK